MIDLTGQRFGRLVVVSPSASLGRGARWATKCDCGGEKIALATDLRAGHVNSCGCMRRRGVFVHGLAKTPTWRSWDSMLTRCTNPNANRFEIYGGRGITVCERWRGRDGFANFLADMGVRPTGRTLDRKDVNGNYEPGNCRWATDDEQARNRQGGVLEGHEAAQIRWLVAQGFTQASVAAFFEVNKSTVSLIIRGKTWKEESSWAA